MGRVMATDKILPKKNVTIPSKLMLAADQPSAGTYPTIDHIELPGWVSSYLFYHGLSPYRPTLVYYHANSQDYVFGQ